MKNSVNPAQFKLTGLFNHLSDDQKKFVLDYDGPSNVGGKEFRLDFTTYPHQPHCNASRLKPIFSAGCSCRFKFREKLTLWPKSTHDEHEGD